MMQSARARVRYITFIILDCASIRELYYSMKHELHRRQQTKYHAILINTSLRLESAYPARFRAYFAKTFQKKKKMDVHSINHFAHFFQIRFVDRSIIVLGEKKKERGRGRVNCCGRVPK